MRQPIVQIWQLQVIFPPHNVAKMGHYFSQTLFIVAKSQCPKISPKENSLVPCIYCYQAFFCHTRLVLVLGTLLNLSEHQSDPGIGVQD